MRARAAAWPWLAPMWPALMVSASSAQADDGGLQMLDGGVLWPLLSGMLALLTAYVLLRRRQARQQAAALREELEATREELDRAELLLLSEPQVLLLWNVAGNDGGTSDAPSPDTPAEVFVHPQLRGEMIGKDVPPEDFAAWLSEEAVQDIERQLRHLREDGTPFNISLRTAREELIEADGRIVGRRLMLRFRPLHGERLRALSDAHDQRQLQEQARRLTAMLASAPFPVWISDGSERLQWANETLLALLGVPSLEAARASAVPLLGGAERAAATPLPPQDGWQRCEMAAIIGQQQRHFEIWERDFDRGTIHWARETTAEKTLEEELQRRKAAQTRIFDQLPTALAIFDEEQRLVFYNAAYARLWGLEETWLAKRPTEEEILNRLYDAGKLILSEDFPQWRQRHLDIYQRQDTHRERWQLAHGQALEVIAEPQPGEGVIYMFEDITEHMRLEANYREALQVQEETLDSLHDALAVFGTDGRLKLFNRVFGELWRLDEAILRLRPHVDEIIAKCQALADDARLWDDLKASATGMLDERKSLAGRITHADGHVLDYLITPLPDGNTLITWHDMTDALRAEQALRERAAALEESDRAKTAFLDSISYDLRTPLTTINGYTEMLISGYAGALGETQAQYLRNVQEASHELLEKIDTILDLAAIDAGKMALDISSFEVLPMLEELAEGLAPKLERRDMELEIELAEDVREMTGDRKRTMQALRHLLLNAIGFGHKGTVVRMGARRDEDGHVSFWVADTGPGMDAEMMRRAFERFFARPSPEGHRGPGLGLPLVKAIVELHGGKVELHSREGRGTTVIARFPQPAMAEQQA